MKILKELRYIKGVTQKEVADYLGITRAAYTNIENEKRETDFNTLKKLSNYFDVPTDYLLGKTDDPTPLGKRNTAVDASEDDIKFALFGVDDVGDITDEMYEEVKGFADYIKEKYKDRFDKEK